MHGEKTKVSDNIELVSGVAHGEPENKIAVTESEQVVDSFETMCATHSTGYASTASDQNCEHKAWWHWQKIGVRLAVLWLSFGGLLQMILVQSLTESFFHRFTQNSQVYYATQAALATHASVVGFALAFFFSVEFFRGFLKVKANRLRTFMLGLLAVSICAAACADSMNNGIVAALCCVFVFLAGRFGQLIADALPSTFRSARAISLTALATAPATLITLAACYHVSKMPDRPSTHLISSIGIEGFCIAAMFFFIGIPAFCFVGCARTIDLKPLITIGLLQASPLLVGIFAQSLILMSGQYGLSWAPACLLSILSVIGVLATSSSLAAWANWHKYKGILRS
ncbi:MAG: hypothetical protein IAF58_14910 [Leptolyngbya sp.]|nr:hypothetical protein [Candidatus Melainabacteria bacterium]